MREDEPVSRWDLRVTASWLRSNPVGALIVVVVLLAAGAASLRGLLRWQGKFATWSFAALCLGAAVACIWVAVTKKRPPTS